MLEGDIRVDGSSTVYPVTEAVAEEFRVLYPKLRVSVGMSGTGGGFRKFIRGEIDINNASRTIKLEEKKICSQNQINYIELPIAYDGLAVLVHKKNDWVDYFTVEELKRLWASASQGKILRWNQIREEWPDEMFHLYGPGVASGTYDYFTEVIVGHSGSSRGDYTASEDDNVLVQGVAGDRNAIGFLGMAYYMENKEKMRLIPIDNGNGPVTPNATTVKDGTYVPLSRPIFIYVTMSSATRPEVRKFVEFYIKNAATLVADVGYVPLPTLSYEQSMASWHDFIKKSTTN